MQYAEDISFDQYDDAYCLLFNGAKVLLKLDDSPFPFPSPQEITSAGIVAKNQVYLGEKNGKPMLGATIDQSELQDSYSLTDFRKLYGAVELDDIWLVGKSYQMVQFEQNHAFCGKCGQPNENKTDEKAKICSECGLVVYSKISPAVIMAITKGDEILLASSVNFQEKLFSVLAGFVEPGETLEQCVQREVMEEVGVKVKNIKYFGSQPWPFSSSLMIAYTAEYDSGEINIDEKEIVEAGWYKTDDLPMIPTSISIARQLIDWFVYNNS